MSPDGGWLHAHLHLVCSLSFPPPARILVSKQNRRPPTSPREAKMTNIRAVALVAALALLIPPLAASGQDHVGFTQWYEGLRNLRVDPARGAPVEGLSLTRDVGTFHFERGEMHLLEPIAGRTVGAVFVGEGRFEMTAPELVEREQLHRTYGTADVATAFRAAVLLFTDFTLPELQQSLTWSALPPDRDAEREVEEARQYLADDGWVSRQVALPLINQGPGFFYAHFSEDRGDPLIFCVDPHQFEEVSLSKRTERGKRREVVAQFHRQVDYTTGSSLPPEALDLIAISAYDIETRIEDDLDVVGRATTTLRRTQQSYTWIPFSLYSELRVDSLRWGDGSPAAFYRAEDQTDLWVDFSSAPEGAEVELAFHYSGEMMERPNGLWVQLGTHSTWFPVYQSGREIPYRLTFHAPEDYVVNTVGTRLDESTTDEVTTTVWETPPIRNVTFNIGEFDSFESEVADAPKLSVFVNERAHRRLGGLVAEAGGILLSQRDMAESVALDLRNSFRFYDEVYGPTTVEDFVATEIFYNHGEAYPGLVMLSWSTFQFTTERGFDEMFRAHEVAHQWWGISVRPATYRDWWLAEGFSEFSGWWYAARARGSVDMYMQRLKETREAILERRDRSAPVGLGRRVGTSEHPEDYQLMVYHKGAWVLHMLRTLLTDPETGNDDAFDRVMNTFYTRHLGGVASTRGFQQVVEEVVGADMAWFFDQWVYGSAIPTYTFSHAFEEQTDGQVLARVRIRQEGVPDDFRMIVPILVDFGDEGSALVPVNVTGPVTEGDLPLLPREPDAIVFNPYESVLAETNTEGWRD
jgi:hypothetical protein